MGVLLRVITIVVVLSLTAAVAESAGPTEFATRFLRITALAAPATLTTLMLWCAERRAVPAAARAVAARDRLGDTRAGGLCGVRCCSARRTRLDTGRAGPGGALALGAGIQHYYELRERAFSPAMVEAKYQALQSRIRPHFLFNSLNAVLAVIRTEPAKAERMLESIAELFRAVMADTRKLVPLAQEIELCRNYVEIEQTRLGNRLAVDWQIGAYHPRAKVPQLLLQPVIENAIRYGAEKLPGRADIIVRVRQHGFTLELFVSNPIAPERPEREGNQIGLANIRGRLALMYDLEARIETQVRRDRFELMMTLPVEKRA